MHESCAGPGRRGFQQVAVRLRPEKVADGTDSPVIADADNVYVKSVACSADACSYLGAHPILPG